MHGPEKPDMKTFEGKFADGVFVLTQAAEAASAAAVAVETKTIS